jgi:asparagine synthase (glutamine-hydrolysing)
MSGIIGIYHRDGAPVDPTLLRSLTQFLSYCGPDARDIWTGGGVGLGHTLLSTTHESANERQPATWEGRLSITADARLDARAELIAELETAGAKVRHIAPDSELILQAYAAWGGDCVEHLRGDFAFAIWDAPNKTLFCARDHLGVKPFYYFEGGELFLFSNVLDCLRQNPEVSEELDEAAIADFLLFGLNRDNATTTFRDIQRLPPAHSLALDARGVQVKRYWAAPTDGRIRYRHADEYVENFQFLLQAAVRDRLRADRVSILLSGGLDSASIAATARELTAKPGNASDLRALTVVYESLIPDRDGTFARRVAEFLGIPIRCLPVDRLQLFDRWDDPEITWPEPVDDPFFAGIIDQFKMISDDSRVVLSGEGSDNLMHFEMWPYVRDMSQRKEWARLFAQVPRYLWMRPSFCPGIRRRAKGLLGLDPAAPKLPKWVAPDFARRVNLEARWRDALSDGIHPRHPVNPAAHASLQIPQWSNLFEHENPGVTRFPVEVRHPFLDLRIVNYLLALPPFPWFYEKMLLRSALSGKLPESVRMRPKTPLAGNPLVEHLQMPGVEWVDKVHWNAEMDQFVDRSSLAPLKGVKISEKADTLVRPICLNFWLQSARRVRYNLHAEVSNA